MQTLAVKSTRNISTTYDISNFLTILVHDEKYNEIVTFYAAKEMEIFENGHCNNIVTIDHASIRKVVRIEIISTDTSYGRIYIFV